MKEPKIFKMTRKGLEERKKSLEALKNANNELDKVIALALKNDSEADIKDFIRQKEINNSMINSLEFSIENAEIIEILDMDDELVNIGDILDTNFIFAPDDEEEMTIQLVGGEGSTHDSKVSINSAVGKAIYGRKIGETVSYKANNNNNVKVKLLRKVKPNNPANK